MAGAEPGTSSVGPVPTAPQGSPSGLSTAAAAPAVPQQPGNPGPDGIDYQALVQQMEVQGTPCRVAQLTLTHQEQHRQLRTRQYLIDRELQRVHDATTLPELHAALDTAGRNLSKLGVFSTVSMLVTEEPEDDPSACTVLVDLAEKNWYKAHAGTYFQGGESSAEVGVSLQNVTGRAEKITLSSLVGSHSSSNFQLSYEHPQPWDLPATVEARAQRANHNHQRASSYTDRLLGGLLLGLRSLDGQHALQYELALRQLVAQAALPDVRPSRAVQDQAGEVLQGTARYTWLMDRRGSPASPSAGWALRACSEVAGLSPDKSVRYAKQQLDAQLTLPLVRGAYLNFLASTGVMLPWGSGATALSKPTPITDRFFLGGPSTLRGFKFKGVGPSDPRRRPTAAATAGSSSSSRAAAGRDALGGDLYSSVLAELNVQLPHPALRALNMQAHVFANGGNCVALAGTGQTLPAAWQQFTNTWRWSAGVGLVLPTWFGRFEANYVHVLSAQEHDRLKQGLQFGFAMSPIM